MENNHQVEKENPTAAKIIKGNYGDTNFKVNLRESHYVIRDPGGTDTLTFIDAKKEDLEYSAKDGRIFIRDKASKNVVTFDDIGYAGRKQNIDKAYAEFNLTTRGNRVNSHYENALDININYEHKSWDFNKMHGFYQRGLVPASLLSRSATDVISALDEKIRVAKENNDQQAVNEFTAEKNAFSHYTSQLINLDINHGAVIEKIKIGDTTYNAKDLLISQPLGKSRTHSDQNISDIVDITKVEKLRDKVSDYTLEEIEKAESDIEEARMTAFINNEKYSPDTMIEYMAGFKDLGQELGIQRIPNYFDFQPMQNIAMPAVQ
ncbi:hypothetical protein [Yersinia vastinensis]|uniref:hypothetical protein n=1 Tax=Yersinia vastinensis TaxID=2890318 RepID=UPI0011A7EEB7|nr:hypothetical protein [Yersinia vastinensis]